VGAGLRFCPHPAQASTPPASPAAVPCAKRKRLRRYIIGGTLLTEWSAVPFAFPAFDANRPGQPHKGRRPTAPGFSPTTRCARGENPRRPLLLSCPTPVWSQIAGRQTKTGGIRCPAITLTKGSTLMAHELDITNGVASFAARTDAWHRLGQTVGHSMTAEEALAAAHLAGWNVRKMALQVPLQPVITDDGGRDDVRLWVLKLDVHFSSDLANAWPIGHFK
jgi:hypothetical protein